MAETVHKVIRQIAGVQLINWKSRQLEEVLKTDNELKEEKRKYGNTKLTPLQDRLQLEGPGDEVRELLAAVGCEACF